MSNRAIDAVKDFSKTKGSVRLLMFVIADGINKSTGIYDAKIETLKNECNCSERWVQTCINKATAAGELIIFERTGHRSAFAIPIYQGEQGYDPQPCESEDHFCSGFHTPLSVDRETVRREEYQQQRRQRRNKSGRKATQGVNDTAPLRESAEGGELLITGGCTIDHRGVNDRSPGGEQECTQYPLDTPSFTPVHTVEGPNPDSINQAETWSASSDGQAWMRRNRYDAAKTTQRMSAWRVYCQEVANG